VNKLVAVLTIVASMTLAGHARATTVNILEFTPTFVPGEPISSEGSNPNLDAALARQLAGVVLGLEVLAGVDGHGQGFPGPVRSC
jgi:hypothetical protein